jgi:hypothetical protein
MSRLRWPSSAAMASRVMPRLMAWVARVCRSWCGWMCGRPAAPPALLIRRVMVCRSSGRPFSRGSSSGLSGVTWAVPLESSYRPLRRQQRRKASSRTAGAGVVTAEFLDEFGVLANHPVAALDPGLARGNPRRRLLVRSKGHLDLLAHDDLLHRDSPWTSGAERPLHHWIP